MVIALLAIVALGLLVVALVVDVSAFSYGALGLCALAGALMVVERVVRSRRAGTAAGTASADDHPPVAETDDEPAGQEGPSRHDDATADRSDDERDKDAAADRDEDRDEDDVAAPQLVLVAPGRKRFHRRDCDLLAEVTAEEITVAEAQAEGFSACSVCRPAGALAT